jgi:hypothetical protein
VRFLLSIILILVSWSAYASIGAVSELEGKGKIKRTDGAKVDLEQSLDVFSYDEVMTGQGRTAIDFIDDTRVEVTEHSKLIIDEFVYDPANNQGGLTLTAALGTVRYASGQIAKDYKDNVKIKTPTATIGVRGTDFAMIVDELGGSTIILLPSCNSNGNCVVGEISVDSAMGQVILNQAFQATRVEVAERRPTPAITLEIDESLLGNLLIVSPPREIDDLEDEQSVRSVADILGLDFLEIDVLDQDLLAQDEQQWQTELDIDFLAGDFLGDVLAQLNKILAAEFLSELTDVFVKKQQQVGQLPGKIILLDQGSNWFFRREGSSSVVQLRLNKNYGYTLDLQQDDFTTRDFIIGEGAGNDINIIQK